MYLVVKNILGFDFATEDILVLKNYVKDGLARGQKVTLDFTEMPKICATFFYTLLLDIMCQKGRKFIEENIKIENMSNINEYHRFLYGC